MNFVKMHGIGNDYVYIDCFREPVPENIASLAVAVSDRHKGVGGDGLVLIMPSSIADCRMRMFNADGSEGKMCGNAIRCVGKYVYEEGHVKDTEMRIETASGVKRLRVEAENGVVERVTVDMGSAEYGFVEKEIKVGERIFKGTQVDVGNPHCVVRMTDVEHFELEKWGPMFENHELFPDRVNTEIVEKIGKNRFRMRVWERGSGETMACGTGACATVAAMCLLGEADYDAKVTVELRGGNLEIVCTSERRIFMSGTATRVFTGTTCF